MSSSVKREWRQEGVKNTQEASAFMGTFSAMRSSAHISHNKVLQDADCETRIRNYSRHSSKRSKPSDSLQINLPNSFVVYLYPFAPVISGEKDSFWLLPRDSYPQCIAAAAAAAVVVVVARVINQLTLTVGALTYCRDNQFLVDCRCFDEHCVDIWNRKTWCHFRA